MDSKIGSIRSQPTADISATTNEAPDQTSQSEDSQAADGNKVQTDESHKQTMLRDFQMTGQTRQAELEAKLPAEQRVTKDSIADMRKAASLTGGQDPNALVQSVLRQSYLETTEDLRSYAEKVKYFNETKKQIREHMEGLKNADAGLREEFSRLQPGQTSNVMEAVTQLIRDSVKDSNEDKKYYLRLLEGMNKTNAALSAMMDEMTESSQRLATKEKDDDD